MGGVGGWAVVGGLRVSGISLLPGWFFTSGLLPDNTGIQWEMNNWGDNSSLLFSIYNKSESYIQINM